MNEEKRNKEERNSLDLDQLMQQLRERERLEREKLLQENRARRSIQELEEEESYAYVDPLYDRETPLAQLPPRKERRRLLEEAQRFRNRTLQIPKKRLYAGLVILVLLGGTAWAISAFKGEAEPTDATVVGSPSAEEKGSVAEPSKEDPIKGTVREDETAGGTNEGAGEKDDLNAAQGGNQAQDGDVQKIGGGSFSKQDDQGVAGSGASGAANVTTDKAVYQEVKNYVVQEGDTLWSITMKFYHNGQYVDFLKEYNNITDPSTQLKVGMKIQIPSPAPPLGQ